MVSLQQQQPLQPSPSLQPASSSSKPSSSSSSPGSSSFNLRLVLLGFFVALIALSPQLRSRLLGPIGFGSTMSSSVDHQSWRVYQKLQASVPVIPNHNPSDLGEQPPEDLIARKRSEKGGKRPGGKVDMPLPKKVQVGHLDEL